MRQPESLAQIVANGLCMGCGLCESLAGTDVLRLEMTPRGGERPVRVGTLDPQVEKRILATCPGATINAPAKRHGTAHDVVWGNGMRVVKAHAVDPIVRFQGTSGGVLSALCIHLLETRQVEFVLHVAASNEEPVRSAGQVSFDQAEILEGARARYGPAAPLRSFAQLLDQGRRFAFVGKPCDVAAVRNLSKIDSRVTALVPYLLTMVCGGASELGMSTDYLEECGITEDDVAVFRYRGYGNPGPTHVETRDGRVFEKTYQEFWGGGESTWRLQFRCKICPDAIGEQADIVAMDAWPGADPIGEDEGFNVMIARTPAGLELLNGAERAGALNVLRELPLREPNRLQPHQVERRRAALARLSAYSLATGVRPGFRGHRLVRSAIKLGLRANLTNFAGTWRRVRAGRHWEGDTFNPPSDVG
jgi:coenzyme F420 hydrogenase subunit beta